MIKEAFLNIDFKTLLIFSAVFLALFIVAEIGYHILKIKVGYTRKFVHVFTGVIAMFFPIYIEQPLDLILLCMTFAIILTMSKKWNLLQSINAIERTSRGSVLYPLIVILCFLVQFYKGNVIYFFIPILVLAFADPMAEYAGRKLKYKPFSVLGNSKTISGSLAFFVTALLTSIVSMHFKEDLNLVLILSCSIVIALLTTVGEAISIKGYDNFIIPICAILGLMIFSI